MHRPLLGGAPGASASSAAPSGASGGASSSSALRERDSPRVAARPARGLRRPPLRLTVLAALLLLLGLVMFLRTPSLLHPDNNGSGGLGGPGRSGSGAGSGGAGAPLPKECVAVQAARRALGATGLFWEARPPGFLLPQLSAPPLRLLLESVGCLPAVAAPLCITRLRMLLSWTPPPHLLLFPWGFPHPAIVACMACHSLLPFLSTPRRCAKRLQPATQTAASHDESRCRALHWWSFILRRHQPPAAHLCAGSNAALRALLGRFRAERAGCTGAGRVRVAGNGAVGALHQGQRWEATGQAAGAASS